MILKQNTFNLVVETVSSSEISSASLSNPFRESRTSRNWKSQNLTRELRAAREFVFKVIDNLSRVIDFYWSINDVWHLGGSAMVAGLLLKGSWFSSRRFFSSLTLPLPRFLRYPLVPGSARLKNPRWRSISKRNGFSAMKPPVTACKQATYRSVQIGLDWRMFYNTAMSNKIRIAPLHEVQLFVSYVHLQ